MKPGQKNPHSSEKGFSGAKRVYLTFNFPGDVSFFFFPLFLFFIFFFPPTFFPPFTSFALPQRELFSVNKSERLGEVAYSTIEFLKLEIVAIERWKVEMKGVK